MHVKKAEWAFAAVWAALSIGSWYLGLRYPTIHKMQALLLAVLVAAIPVLCLFDKYVEWEG